MKAKQRFDSVRIKAHFDEHGFLVDRPIVARIGLQTYQTPNGIRREFRPANEVFKSDSLATYAGKPVTLGHTTVTPDNAKDVVVGSCFGSGVRSGIGVEVPLNVYDKAAIESAKRGDAAELSVGYTSVDIDLPGWGSNETGEYVLKQDAGDDYNPPSDWVEFDALQTDIRVNHVAMVFKGRAGIAKLNLDSEQDFPYISDVENKQDDEGRYAARMRLAQIDDDSGVDKAIGIDALDEEYTVLNSDISGIPEFLQEKIDRIVSLTGIHEIILKNKNVGGVSQSQNTALETFYKLIDRKRKEDYRPILEFLIKFVVDEQEWSIEFEPLSVPSDKDEAEILAKNVESVTKLVTAQVIDSKESRDTLRSLCPSIKIGKGDVNIELPEDDKPDE